MASRLRIAARIALACSGAPLLAQDFEGVARLRYLGVDAATLARLGAPTPDQLLGIPHVVFAALADTGAALSASMRVFVHPPHVRIDVGDGSAMQQLLLDYESEQYWQVDRDRQWFTRLGRDDPELGSLIVFFSAGAVNVLRTVGQRGAEETIRGLRARPIDVSLPDLHMRLWLADHASGADWRALARTLGRVGRAPFTFPALTTPPMPVRIALLNPPDGSGGLVFIDYISIVRGSVDTSLFALPTGFREVSSGEMRGEAAAAPAATIDSSLPADVVADAFVEDRPKRVHCPPPVYPPAARDAGIQGRVVLRFVVDTAGRVEPASLRTFESPHDSLSAAARRMALACTFTAGRVGGRAVRVLVSLPVDFTLPRP